MKNLIAALLLLATGLAHAGIFMAEGAINPSAGATTNIVTQACNVQLNQCSLADDAGHNILVAGQRVYSDGVTMAVDGNLQPCVAASAVTYQTQYRIDRALTITCSNGSMLEGTWTSSRSGSGRGGWSWHQHVSFDTLTLY